MAAARAHRPIDLTVTRHVPDSLATTAQPAYMRYPIKPCRSIDYRLSSAPLRLSMPLPVSLYDWLLG